MENLRKIIHNDEQLQFASRYLIYHIKMYVETLLWLHDHSKPDIWDTVRNSVIETHLVHERILINFICNGTARDTDVLAVDYFSDTPNTFYPRTDDFLREQAQNIGSQLVHLTTKPMPKLKSQQEWFIRETSEKLIPALKTFLYKVSENKFPTNIKLECIRHLERLASPDIPVSLTAST
jgi:hypothetical protein